MSVPSRLTLPASVVASSCARRDGPFGSPAFLCWSARSCTDRLRDYRPRKKLGMRARARARVHDSGGLKAAARWVPQAAPSQARGSQLRQQCGCRGVASPRWPRGVDEPVGMTFPKRPGLRAPTGPICRQAPGMRTPTSSGPRSLALSGFAVVGWPHDKMCCQAESRVSCSGALPLCCVCDRGRASQAIGCRGDCGAKQCGHAGGDAATVSLAVSRPATRARAPPPAPSSRTKRSARWSRRVWRCDSLLVLAARSDEMRRQWCGRPWSRCTSASANRCGPSRLGCAAFSGRAAAGKGHPHLRSDVPWLVGRCCGGRIPR